MKYTITRKVALETALTFVPSDNTEVREVLSRMIKQVTNSHTPTDETRAQRRERTAQARAALVEKVAPVLRKHLTYDITAKELFEVAKDELPQGFSAAKVQNILIRELSPELFKTATNGKANTYRLR